MSWRLYHSVVVWAVLIVWRRVIPRDRILSIIGVGLIGGSVGLAVKARGLFDEVRGTTRRSSTLETALSVGAIDRGFTEAAEAARGADMVVVATSVSAIPSFCLQCAKTARDGAIITDVGSVKGAIEAKVRPGMPAGRHFIGSHPLAGGEKTGAANASATLLSGATCIITPAEDVDAGKVEELSRFWQDLGMKVFAMSPAEHDAILGSVSHLPHLVASCLVQAVSDSALPFGASGLRDTTRVAAGDARLWRDIVEANQQEIIESVERFEDALETLKGLILRSDWQGVEDYLAEAADKRRKKFPQAKEGDST